METEWILKVVLVGLIHWVLAGLVLPDLARRQRVIGGRKAPWAVAILFITGFGSLAYLMFHPQMLTQEYAERELCHEKKDIDCR